MSVKKSRLTSPALPDLPFPFPFLDFEGWGSAGLVVGGAALGSNPKFSTSSSSQTACSCLCLICSMCSFLLRSFLDMPDGAVASFDSWALDLLDLDIFPIY